MAEKWYGTRNAAREMRTAAKPEEDEVVISETVLEL
jgi:hypothetical protein